MRKVFVSPQNFPVHDDRRASVFTILIHQDDSPEGDSTPTVAGLPCARRWISCTNVGRMRLLFGSSVTVFPVRTDL